METFLEYAGYLAYTIIAIVLLALIYLITYRILSAKKKGDLAGGRSHARQTSRFASFRQQVSSGGTLKVVGYVLGFLLIAGLIWLLIANWPDLRQKFGGSSPKQATKGIQKEHCSAQGKTKLTLSTNWQEVIAPSGCAITPSVAPDPELYQLECRDMKGNYSQVCVDYDRIRFKSVEKSPLRVLVVWFEPYQKRV